MAHIDFEAKTDRELLVLVAQVSNETVGHLAKLNNSILKHEQRITALEIHGGCNASESTSWKSVLKVNWQIITWIACVGALIAMKIGEYLGWL